MGRRLSLSDSAKIVACIERWMQATSVTSTYELALIVGVPRGTLQRWLTRTVRLPISAVRQIAEGLAEHARRTAEAQKALAELTQLCQTINPLEEQLYTELRARGARVGSVMAAIEAAGFRLVPSDDASSLDSAQSQPTAKETSNENSSAT